MSYTPHLFIGVGATSAYYTLRETYLHEQWVGGAGGSLVREERSFHHFNLSQDVDEALAKASEHAAKVGLRLNADRDSLVGEMREIRRAGAEEMARREAERAEREAQWRAERAERYSHQPTDLERDWLNANVRADEDGEPTGFAASLAQTIRREGGLTEGQLKALRAIVERDFAKANSRHVGEPGQRSTLTLTVDRVLDWSYGSYPTIRRYCNICRDEAGNVIKYIGSNVLTDGPYKVTVKEHVEYRGEKQTIVQRPKLLA